MAKIIKFDTEARTKMLQGVDTLANVVKVTLGPALLSQLPPVAIPLDRLHDLTMEYFREFPMVDKGNPISVSAWKFPSKEKFSREFEGKLRYLSMLSWILKKIPTKWASKKNRRIAVLQNAIERLLYYADIYGPYANLNFDFEARKVNELHQSLSLEEQYAYHFDPSRIDWKHYLQQIHIPGIKHHILKMEDELDHLETNDTKNRYPDELTEDPSFQNIPSLLKWRADKLPHKVALQIKRAEGWVRYTYSDFYDLRAFLLKRWPGCYIPPIPPKQASNMG